MLECVACPLRSDSGDCMNLPTSGISSALRLRAPAALGRALLFALTLTAVTSGASANSLESAQKFCGVLDAAGVLAAKCEIASFSTTVALLVQADAKQAEEFCDMVVKLAGENGLTFDMQWKV